MKFKVGDKVIVTRNDLGVRAGEVYTVIRWVREVFYDISPELEYYQLEYNLEKIVTNNKLNRKLYPNYVEYGNYLTTKEAYEKLK